MATIVNSLEDQTNTGGLRRRAFARIRERLEGARKDVRALIDSIPFNITEVPQDQIVNRRVYKFDLTDRDTDTEIRRIIERWFATGGDGPPPRWFLGQIVTDSYRTGAAQEAAKLQSLAERVGEGVQVTSQLEAEVVLTSRPFRDRIDKVFRRTFEEMKGFTGTTATDLARTLSDGVAQGISPRAIAGNIRDRFEVSETRALRIARTEIGQSFRDARRDTAVDARDRLGLEIMMQWSSALAPTTRATHAARHLNFYTPENVAEFYSRDGNAINCLCVQTSVILAADNEILGERKMSDRERDLVDDLTRPARDRR